MSEWDQLNQAEHRDECPDGCSICIDYRAWETCRACGTECEASPDGLSPCCGVPLAVPDTFGEDWFMERGLT